MAWISRTVMGAALAAVTAGAAFAASPLSTNIDVRGNAPQVCSLGGWTKTSGPGGFSAGTSAIVSYDSADLVDASANSIAGAGSTVVLRAQLLCNTGLTWTVGNSKGALRLESPTLPPAGFSNQWLYHLASGPRNAGGTQVGSMEEFDSDGSPYPLGTETHTIQPPRSETIAYFSISFTLTSQTARMLAGAYSETVTLSVSPSL